MTELLWLVPVILVTVFTFGWVHANIAQDRCDRAWASFQWKPGQPLPRATHAEIGMACISLGFVVPSIAMAIVRWLV